MQQQQHDYYRSPQYPPPEWPAPHPGNGSNAFRYVALAAATVVALAAIVLVGLLMYPRSAGTTQVVTAPSTADASQPSSTPFLPQAPSTARSAIADPAPSRSSAGGYSCGSAGGYSIWVLNGNVPCTSAVMVTSQWLDSGTTPGNGDGPAGTPYSWSCTTGTSSAGYCTSKMGSTFTINR